MEESHLARKRGQEEGTGVAGQGAAWLFDTLGALGSHAETRKAMDPPISLTQP